MPSNIGDVRDSINDAKSDLQENMATVTRKESEIVEQKAQHYLFKDANWTGRTSQALTKGTDHSATGIFKGFVYVDAAVAPHAKLAEFGSGDKTGKMLGRSEDARPPDSYPSDYPYEAPDFSEDLVTSLLAWIKTKPIATDKPPKEVAREMAMMISAEGTYMHPFIRPAWQDRVGPRGRGRMLNNIEDGVKDAFD